MLSSPIPHSRVTCASRKQPARGRALARSARTPGDARSSSSASTEDAELSDDPDDSPPPLRRRQLLASTTTSAAVAASSLLLPPRSQAFQPPGFKKDLTKKGGRRRTAIPPESYVEGPRGLKYYDFVVGTGNVASEGDRVVVHYEARWKGVTFMTSRQGMGVTGGNPLGFDVGAKAGAGGTLPGLDLGVRGMRVGGQRRLIVPPELAYGSKGVGEVPGGATLEFEVELLSVKNSPLGYRVKLVEG